MKKYKATVEVRSQHSVGSSRGFGGPDTYAAVQAVPEGVEPLRSLNSSHAEKRGIVIVYCGEGYSQNCKTTRSSLRRAIDKAEDIAGKINAGSDPHSFE